MTAIDKYAYRSKISGVRAENKLVFACSIMIVCLVFSSAAISVLTIVTMSAATLFWGGCRLKKYLKLLMIPLTFLVTGVITIVINQTADYSAALVSFRLFGGFYGISAESLRNGLNILLKAFGAVTCLYFFSLNTPMNSFLSLLRKRTPGVLVELMELIYRFIFIIWEEAAKIHTAQSSRLGYKGFVNSMNSLGELVTTVFIRAFRRVERVNISLESRGFDGTFEFLIEEERPSKSMGVCTVFAVAVLIAVGILERLYT